MYVHLYVHLFGDFRVSTDTHFELELRPTAARLFAFLLLHRNRAHLREVVAESFWQDSAIDRARKSLNTTLWQLRNTLPQTQISQANVIAATPERIKINQEANLWIDVASFEEKAKQGLADAVTERSPALIGALEAAVALYQDDLLKSFYDPWVLSERERLRMLYLRCLTRLMEMHRQQHNLSTSIDYAQRILSVEPCREDIHRTLMTLYAESGRRAHAIEQYKVCRQILASELAAPPLDETEALYRRLRTDAHIGSAQIGATNVHPSASNSNGSKESTLQEAIAQLQVAIQTTKDAQRALARAVTVVDRFIQS